MPGERRVTEEREQLIASRGSGDSQKLTFVVAATRSGVRVISSTKTETRKGVQARISETHAHAVRHTLPQARDRKSFHLDFPPLIRVCTHVRRSSRRESRCDSRERVEGASESRNEKRGREKGGRLKGPWHLD